MSNDDTIAQLRHELAIKDHELRDAQMVGIAVGVLLARTPGWTEQDALAAWHDACADLTRDGNTQALASYVMQTGTLPGQGVTAHA